MTSEIYFRIVLLALGRDCVATTFTLGDFFPMLEKVIRESNMLRNGPKMLENENK